MEIKMESLERNDPLPIDFFDYALDIRK